MSQPKKAKPAPPVRTSPAMPDRRLASLFARRSVTAPVNATAVAMLSSYLPSPSGQARFAVSLRSALLADRPGMTVKIVRVRHGGARSDRAEVVHEIRMDEPDDARAAAAALNKFDVVIIQHQEGIYGDQVLKILEWINVPVVAIIDNIPAQPSSAVIEKLADSADAVVVLTETGRQRLLNGYRVAPRKVMLIQRGARMADAHVPAAPWTPGSRPTILTWGFLAPGKGIEWGIEALPELRDMRPLPKYVIAGLTHPDEAARHGERYRQWLTQRAEQLQVSHMVEFRPHYVGDDQLPELMAQADVILLPYDGDQPVDSHPLVEALAAQVPVVATRFEHAQELMAGQRGGLLVAPGDGPEIAAALSHILTKQGSASQAIARDPAVATMFSWSLIGSQYRQLLDALLRRPANPLG
jgi:glycosyltransferase involved in cell wall biosynthesis